MAALNFPTPTTVGETFTQNSKTFRWDGTSWLNISIPEAAGGNTQVQFNDSSVLAGNAGFTFNKTTNNITVGNTVIAAAANVTGSVNASSFTVGSLFTANSTLVNAVALIVTNQTNTGTLYVTTSANIGTALIVNSTVATTGSTVNVNMDSGVLFVDALNNRVGINNTAPGVALRVTGAVDISSTANVQGNANVGGTLGITGAANALSTLGITGAANALSTLGVNGLLTASGNLNAPVINASANLNVGTVGATTFNSTITNTAISVGNSTINTTANSTVILVNGVDRIATQKRSIAMSLVFGR